jgi:hypothetical protein
MKRLLVVVGLAGLLLVPGTAQAQFFVGAQGNYADDFDWGVGARAGYDFRKFDEPIALIGTFDYFFPPSVSGVDTEYYEFNLNGVVMGGFNPQFDAYMGLGLNLARFRSEDSGTAGAEFDRAGLNLLAGFRAKFGKGAGAFFEARFQVEGGKQFVLTGGLDYMFGRNN